MSLFADVKVVIFDMDGTLYHEDSFVARYLRHMLEERLGEEQVVEAIEEAYAILGGKHFVSLGMIYDTKSGNIYDHEALKLSSPHNWQGVQIIETVEIPDQNDLITIGDTWEVAQVIGIRYGATMADKKQAFTKVRAEMLEKQYAIPLPSDLSEAIHKLDVEQKIVITNSPFESGQVFLEFMNILPLFDRAVYSGNKPFGMYELLEKLSVEGYKPNEILSIGDNGFNDLYPAYQHGAYTIHIAHYKTVNSPNWDLTVNSLAELAVELTALSYFKKETKR